MAVQTPEQLRAVVASIMPGGPADLCEIAAQRALNELICNWSAALGNGYTLPHLAQDVDSVIEILGQFKEKCLKSGAAIKGAAA